MGTRAIFSATKDLESNFQSTIARWAWTFYIRRLTRNGRWLMWPTVIFAGYGAMSLSNQGYVAFAYTMGLWIVAAACMLLMRPRVRLDLRHAERVCAGETMPVDVTIQHFGRLGGHDLLLRPHRLPEAVDCVPADGVRITPLARGEKTNASFGLSCPRRGVYTLRGFRVESDYPFGLLTSWRLFAEDRPLIVYPKFSALARLALPTGRRYQPGGVALASNLGESFEYIGNREYRDGDSIRDIDWRATARMSRPIVREYRDEYFMRVAVILDTHVPKRARPAQHDAFERAVSLTAGVADYMARQEYLVDIFAAGPNLYHLTAGRSLAYLDQILDILACVDENPAEPFETLEPQLMESLAKITTVICVFLDWNEPRRAFVHRLASSGSAIKVIIARDQPCSIDPSADADLLGAIPVIDKAAFDAGVEEL